MVDMKSIHELTARIVRAYHPERVLLFGSYAYGTPSADSDVDLLVILPCEGKGARKAVEILNTVDAKFPVDLLVRTPQQIRQRLARNDFFLREIIEKGKVLYEASHPISKTHNLTALLDLLVPVEPSWETLRPHLRALTVFAVEVRYPGESADKAQAREALALCREVRRRARSSLGSEP